MPNYVFTVTDTASFPDYEILGVAVNVDEEEAKRIANLLRVGARRTGDGVAVNFQEVKAYRARGKAS